MRDRGCFGMLPRVPRREVFVVVLRDMILRRFFWRRGGYIPGRLPVQLDERRGIRSCCQLVLVLERVLGFVIEQKFEVEW